MYILWSMPSIICNLPTPVALIHPQTSMEPPPYLIVNMRFFWIEFRIFFRHTVRFPLELKILNLLSSEKSTVFQYSWDLLKCCFANSNCFLRLVSFIQNFFLTTRLCYPFLWHTFRTVLMATCTPRFSSAAVIFGALVFGSILIWRIIKHLLVSLKACCRPLLDILHCFSFTKAINYRLNCRSWSVH